MGLFNKDKKKEAEAAGTAGGTKDTAANAQSAAGASSAGGSTGAGTAGTAGSAQTSGAADTAGSAAADAEDSMTAAEASKAAEQAAKLKELAKHVFTTENNSYIIAYDENTLIYEHKRKHGEYKLNYETVVTYECEEGLRGVRELAIWTPDTGLFGGKKTNEHSLYRPDAAISFSKKDSDRYFHLFYDIRSCLSDKILFFSPEKEYVDIELDHSNRVMRAFLGKKARYIPYKDIIGADLDTHLKTLSTSKKHVGRALSGGREGAVNGAAGKNDSQTITTVEGYDVIIYLENEEYTYVKKSYESDDAEMVNELFGFLQELVGKDGIGTAG